jgi:hypothetical protein
MNQPAPSPQELYAIHLDGLYDTEYVACHYQLCRRTLENWRVSGNGPKYVKVGRLVRYAGAALIAWERKNTLEHSGQKRGLIS